MAGGQVLHGLPAPVRTAAPATNPVSLAEAKAHLRVDHSDHDTRIASLIEGATANLDGYTGILGRALVTQTWRQDFPAFTDLLRLPLRPVASITIVTYYDANNAQQTLASTVYGLFSDALGAYVALKPDQTFPSTYARRDAVSITYVAGVAASAVPGPIKQAILLQVEILYDRPDGSPLDGLERASASLLRPYMAVGV